MKSSQGNINPALNSDLKGNNLYQDKIIFRIKRVRS